MKAEIMLSKYQQKKIEGFFLQLTEEIGTEE